MWKQKTETVGGAIPAVFFILLLSALGGLILGGCSGNPPEIRQVRSRLVRFDDREKNLVYEYLSVALLADDEDGRDDLENFSVIHDGSELYWLIPPDRRTTRPVLQETWIGADMLVTADYSALPRGKYRVLLWDYSGAQAEAVFNLKKADLSKRVMPLLRLEGESLVLETDKTEAVLMVRSSAGTLIGSFILKKGPNSRTQILANPQVKSQARHLYLYQIEGDGEFALMSGPFAASDFLFAR
jgi:hypothetical protein